MLDRLESAGDAETAQRLAGVLWVFWNLRGYVAEGTRRLEAVLSADERPTATRARALTGASAAAALRGDVGRARARAEEALAIQRAVGDAWWVALAQSSVAIAAAEAKDWHQARKLAADLYRLARALAVSGRPGPAARLLGKGCALLEETGTRLDSYRAAEAKVGETAAELRARLGEAAFAQACEQGRKLTPEEAVELAFASLD